MTKLIKPGESILIRVFLDKNLSESEACAEEILFDDFVESLNKDWRIELVQGNSTSTEIKDESVSFPQID